jgi:hypothetical protein
MILKYAIYTLLDAILSISGLISIISIYTLYNSKLIFYFVLYNIIISIFDFIHFFKIFKDMINETLNDVAYVKIKTFLMTVSFIWGVIILQERNIIKFYQHNHPQVYINFIIYFIMSSLSILNIFYNILLYFHNKKTQIINYDFVAQINKEFPDNESLTNIVDDNNEYISP